MKLTNYFIFVTGLAMFAPAIVNADTWKASIVCNNRVELTVEHQDDIGQQTIKVVVDATPSGITLCSTDRVICIREVSVTRTNCEKIAADFMVQYGSVWSTNNHANFTRLDNYYFGTISDVNFDPKFT
ncbi:hypothetical protein BD560DRAFT_462865 [Blakeslea trispora]|nr:hypothetical protein BD560DRAFT_462865 [Blakeslea trispora]